MQLTTKKAASAWESIAAYIIENGEFESVSGKTYQAHYIKDVIHYSGPDRNNGDDETISKEEFFDAFNSISKLVDINTNTVKGLIPDKLYRKRSPLIGLMFSAGVLLDI